MSVKGRLTAIYIPDVSFVFSNVEFSFGLSLVYLLTGNGSINGSLHRFGASETTACLCGAPLKNVEHLIGFCRLYDELRDSNPMNVRINDVNESVLTVALITRESYNKLNKFEEALFNRRKRRMNALNE